MAEVEEQHAQTPRTVDDLPEKMNNEGSEDGPIGVAQADKEAASPTLEDIPKDMGEFNDSSITSSKSAKEMGNVEFTKGNYKEAIDHWERGVRSCKFILAKDVYVGEQKSNLEDTVKLLQLNMSIGHIKLREWSSAVNYANEVLKVDPQNIKALYRKCLAQLNMDLYDECIATARQLMTCDPTSAAARQLCVRAEKAKTEYKQRSRKLMKNVFEHMADEQRSPSKFSSFLKFAVFNFLKALTCKVAGVVQSLYSRAKGFMRPSQTDSKKFK